MLALMSDIFEEIASDKAENCLFRQPHGHCHLAPTVYWVPANIRISLILTKIRIIRLHFRCWLCASVFSLFRFFVADSENTCFETECVMAIQGHPRSLIWHESKARMPLPISHQYNNFRDILSRFRDTAGENDHTPIPPEFWGCSLWTRSPTLGLPGAKTYRLISRKIIFEVLQRKWSAYSAYLVVTDRHMTDGQTTCRGITALCVASRGKNYCNFSSIL